MTTPEFTILIDNACPLCRREGRLLARLDRGQGRLALVDIAAPGFDPGRYGRTMDQVMGTIHGVLPDGSIVTGVEVFRRAWRAVGLGWIMAPTNWPVLRPLSDAAYRWFAHHRLRLTGRRCDAGVCRVPSAR